MLLLRIFQLIAIVCGSMAMAMAACLIDYQLKTIKQELNNYIVNNYKQA